MGGYVCFRYPRGCRKPSIAKCPGYTGADGEFNPCVNSYCEDHHYDDLCLDCHQLRKRSYSSSLPQPDRPLGIGGTIGLVIGLVIYVAVIGFIMNSYLQNSSTIESPYSIQEWLTLISNTIGIALAIPFALMVALVIFSTIFG